MSANWICKSDTVQLFHTQIVQLYITSEAGRTAHKKMNGEMSRQEKWLSIQRRSTETLPSCLQWFMRANMCDLFLRAKNCPLSLIVMWMRLEILTWAYTPALRSRVKHYFKAHQREHSDYSDVFATLRHHSVSVTTSKWRLQVPLAQTLGCHRNEEEGKKKNPSVLKWRQPINQTELNVLSVLCEDDLSNIQKRSAFHLHTLSYSQAVSDRWCQLYLQGEVIISWTPVQSKCASVKLKGFCWETVSEGCWCDRIVIREAVCGL